VEGARARASSADARRSAASARRRDMSHARRAVRKRGDEDARRRRDAWNQSARVAITMVRGVTST
jgi:hypothetical protein